MGRAVLIINTQEARAKAAEWVTKAPWGTSVTFKRSKRSLPQNERLWASLTDIAEQVEWYGEKLTAIEWKDVFTAGLRKSRVVPGLDGASFVVLGQHTSDMTKDEFGDLLEIINAFAAERGVVLKDGSEPDNP